MVTPLRRSSRAAAAPASPESSIDVFEFASSPAVERTLASRVKALPKAAATAVPARRAAAGGAAPAAASAAPAQGAASVAKSRAAAGRRGASAGARGRGDVLATPARPTRAVAALPGRTGGVLAGALLQLDPTSPGSAGTWAGVDPDLATSDEDSDAADSDVGEAPRPRRKRGASTAGPRRRRAAGAKRPRSASARKPRAPGPTFAFYLPAAEAAARVAAAGGRGAAAPGAAASAPASFAATASLQSALAAALNKQVPPWDGNAARAPAQGAPVHFVEAQSMVRTTRGVFVALFRELADAYGVEALAPPCLSAFGQWLVEERGVAGAGALRAAGRAARAEWRAEYKALSAAEREGFQAAAVAAHVAGETSDEALRRPLSAHLPIPRAAAIPDFTVPSPKKTKKGSPTGGAEGSPTAYDRVALLFARKPPAPGARAAAVAEAATDAKPRELSDDEDAVVTRARALARVRAVLPGLSLRARVGSFQTTGAPFVILAEASGVTLEFEPLPPAAGGAGGAGASGDDVAGLLTVTVKYTARSLSKLKVDAEDAALRLGEAFVNRRAVTEGKKRRAAAAAAAAAATAAAEKLAATKAATPAATPAVPVNALPSSSASAAAAVASDVAKPAVPASAAAVRRFKPAGAAPASAAAAPAPAPTATASVVGRLARRRRGAAVVGGGDAAPEAEADRDVEATAPV